MLAALACGPCRAADAVAVTHAALRSAIAHHATQPRAPVLARETFLREPPIDQVSLAPDGRTLAFLLDDGQRSNLVLQDVATGMRTRVSAGADGVTTAWSGDGRRLWIADARGLAVFDAAERTSKRIHEWDVARAQRFWRVDARAPELALLQEIEGDRYRYLLIDANGRSRLLHEAAAPLLDVALTPDGRLAYTAAFDGPEFDTVIRDHAGADARELLRCTGIETCRLVGWSAGRKRLWILSQHGEDALALQRWDAGTTRWTTEHRDAVADADRVVWDAVREDWLAIAYHRDRRRWVANTARDATRLAALERQLPGANLHLSVTHDGALWLVRAQHSNDPADRYFLYRPRTDRLQPLFEHDATAPPRQFADAQPISWRASDGMLVHGYVYLPRGVALAQAPLVAWLHGGPIDRNHDLYHPAVQLLVNRGCAVFLPDFRGSSGYGLRYVRASNGDVGDGRVLADVLDGLDAALALGIGDRARQAVAGHSFGGYASLLAVSHRPERFRFAFAAAAPVDYGWMKQWQASHESAALRGDGPPLALRFVQHGFPFEDAAWRERMQRESPLVALPHLRVPIHLWAGAKDDRVPIKSVVHYAAEAHRQGKQVNLLIDPDAGHVPAGPLGTEAWLYLLESAAHREFGGGVTPPSAALDAFLRAHRRIEDRS